MSRLLKNKNKNLFSKIYLHYIEPQISIEDFKFYDAQKIDKLKDNSINDIFLNDLLDYNNSNDNITLLNKCIEKLKPNGKIHIQGFDTRAICHGLTYGQIDISLFKNLVFSNGKINIHSIEEIKNILNKEYKNKLVIEKIKFLNGLQYYIECGKITINE